MVLWTMALWTMTVIEQQPYNDETRHDKDALRNFKNKLITAQQFLDIVHG